LASSFVSPPPANFTQTSPDELDRAAMIHAVTHGEAGTAMMSFERVLNSREIEAVVDFVRQEFMTDKKINTVYHTIENGWENHQQYAIAYPFALSEIPLDKPWEELTPEQQQGKRLFMSSCITCHDRARVDNEGAIWESRPLSYPRNNYSHKTPVKVDAKSGASPYAVHEVAPELASLSEQEKQGERLFQQNCAFCHSEDGTGKNWIGSFLDAHPRDLTGASMKSTTVEQLTQVIRDGLPETTMSAWKSVLNDKQIQAIVMYVMKAFIHNEDTSQEQPSQEVSK